MPGPNPGMGQAGTGPGVGQAGAAPKGMGLAQKLLEKMGWREGQGLGRNRQGMATPLVAQKTAAHAGMGSRRWQVGSCSSRGSDVMDAWLCHHGEVPDRQRTSQDASGLYAVILASWCLSTLEDGAFTVLCVPLCLCSGVIVNADLPADKRPRLQGAAFNGPPTRVLVLRNMVGPGEVDEDLEEEVRLPGVPGNWLCKVTANCRGL